MYAVLFAILLVTLFTILAMAVDLSDARARMRDNSTVADTAALAAGNLLAGDEIAACNSAWVYVQATLVGLPVGATSPCTSGVDEDYQARYDGGAGCDPDIARFYRALNEDPYEITFIYPVTQAVLNDYSATGRGPNTDFDGDDPCERFGVQIVSDQGTFFGGIAGVFSLEAPATSIVRSTIGNEEGTAVALILLDPEGCDALLASGQAQVFVYAHDIQNPGRITVDSNGTKSSNPNTCTQGADRYTMDASGQQNSAIKACGSAFAPANPTVCEPGGIIQLFAYQPGQVTCLDYSVNHACHPNDLATNRLYPTPTRASRRATRAPADHEWNCKTGYPNYRPYGSGEAVAIRDCPDDGDVPAYIDQLRFAIDPLGLGLPPVVGFASYNAWYNGGGGQTGGGFNACSPAPGTVVPNGNWWVNCTGNQGFLVNLSAGESVEFSGGNVVFQGNVTLQGGEFRMNTNNVTADLPANCRRPNNLCPTGHSAHAAYAFFRSGGSLTKNAQAQLTMEHVAVYIHNGTINIGAGAPPLTWTAPHQIDSPNPGDAASPLDKLALWSESTQTHVLGGQAPLNIEGVYFTPNALFNYDGQAAQFLDKAQFFTFRMNVSGQGALRMQPDPAFVLKIPFIDSWLVR